MKKAIDSDIEKVLTQYRTVAVVGVSSDPERPSHRVAEFLQNEGYRVIPVTPKGGEILGEAVYPDLSSIPEPVEVVDVFRRSEDVLPTTEEAIAIGAKALWMQEGVIYEEAAEKAGKAGLTIVMDRCMMKEILRRKEQENEK